MNKIFGYELRRALWNKGFFGLALVTLWYAWQLLNGTIILGVANTAPFSPWSFGAYVARLLPLLSIMLLFLLWNISAEKTRGLELLANATPMKPGAYLLIKCAAAVAAWLLLALLAVLLGLGFLGTLFGAAVDCGSLLPPIALTLAPPLLFFLGLGLLAGRVRPWLLFILMAAALGAGYLPLSPAADLYGASLFMDYPLSLGVLDPTFSVPPAVIVGKIVYLTIGVILLALALTRQRSYSQQGC